MDARGPRVALFLATLQPGGAERALVNLANGIAASGLVVDLVVATSDGALRDEVGAAVQLVELGARHVASATPALIGYLRTVRPAALVSAVTHANVVALFARRIARTPTRVVVIEQNTLTRLWRLSPKRRDQAWVWLAKRWYRWADTVVAVSNGVAADLIAATPSVAGRVVVVPNPVITDRFWSLAAKPLAHPWFSPETPPVVLAIARLEPEKDLPTLLRAFALVRERIPARLLVLGEGSQRPALEAEIRDLGLGEHVALEGFTSNPYPFIGAADVFVLSSVVEGLPTVLVEALALGTPVVSTDCTSGPDDVLGGGRFGRLVGVGDTVALAAAVTDVLQNGGPPVDGQACRPYEQAAVARQFLELLELTDV